MPVLLIDRKRDGGAVIIRGGDVIRLSGEDVSGLRYSRPVHLDAPPRKNTRRRDNDGQASLRQTIRHNPNTLHAMATDLGMPPSVADGVLQELFQGAGDEPPQPVLRRAKGSRAQERQAQQQADLQVSSCVDRLPLAVAPVEQLQPPAPPEQRSAALRSEAMRDEALRSRLAAIRLKDLSASRCPRVRDGYAWFTRQQQVAAQAKTHCVTEMTVATL